MVAERIVISSIRFRNLQPNVRARSQIPCYAWQYTRPPLHGTNNETGDNWINYNTPLST